MLRHPVVHLPRAWPRCLQSSLLLSTGLANRGQTTKGKCGLPLSLWAPLPASGSLLTYLRLGSVTSDSDPLQPLNSRVSAKAQTSHYETTCPNCSAKDWLVKTSRKTCLSSRILDRQQLRRDQYENSVQHFDCRSHRRLANVPAAVDVLIDSPLLSWEAKEGLTMLSSREEVMPEMEGMRIADRLLLAASTDLGFAHRCRRDGRSGLSNDCLLLLYSIQRLDGCRRKRSCRRPCCHRFLD
ncbi:hypothetical protein ACLOJK_007045 [Asimina triloba]